MNHSYMIRIQMKCRRVRARVFIDALPHVRLHSSFQQSTMGKLRAVTSSCCFGMHCSRKPDRLTLLSLTLSSSHSISTIQTCTLLCLIQRWQSMPKSNCITSLMHFQPRPLFCFLPPPALSLSSPPGWKSQEDIEELHNSYLGQWCMVTLVVMWCYLMWKLTARTEKKEKCKEKRKYIRGVDAERKTQNKQSCLLLG